MIYHSSKTQDALPSLLVGFKVVFILQNITTIVNKAYKLTMN